ncbi:Tripartite tricarboxylate transporter substrate binding protein [Rubrivivax sp. A210]|uniref:Bug family tripartite tricarboxylate transporter substrate binding protein n=1 Tax=Rubrivivax sp. A210 TaxID=2772301 RepID=UPI00191B37EA|nr:tripartite tricarboxylate transporter substrate binding protein [Rubrivivax sp. A210]CAD5371293.1 Tripartite tricarboxylate transporter substrate binding protein [Rubrivivax sp. A210]
MRAISHPNRRQVVAGLAACVAAPWARAQAWPAKPIRLIVPFAPGGGTDTFARPLAAKLSTQLGQQVLIDNRAGAGGTVGADAAAKAAADGYTFLVGAVHHTVAVTAYRRLGYDLQKDLTPITGIAYVPDVLVVNNEVPARTLQEFIAWCKANPGKVNFGSSGNGTTRHLIGEVFNARTGMAMAHIPYKGSGPAMTALLGGEIQLIFEGLGSAASHIRAGKVRALAVTSPRRPEAFADIPTTAEAGLPGFESLSWYGLWAPAAVPAAINARLRSEVARAFEAPEMKSIWHQQGAETGGEASEQFARFVSAEIDKWGKAVRAVQLVMD